MFTSKTLGSQKSYKFKMACVLTQAEKEVYMKKETLHRFTNEEGKIPISFLLKCLVFSYIITGILLLLLAFLLFRFDVSEKFLAGGIFVIYICSTFFAGFLAGKKLKNRKSLWGLVLGLAYYIVLVSISLIVNHSLGDLTFNFFSSLIFCVGGGMLGEKIAKIVSKDRTEVIEKNVNEINSGISSVVLTKESASKQVSKPIVISVLVLIVIVAVIMFSQNDKENDIDIPYTDLSGVTIMFDSDQFVMGEVGSGAIRLDVDDLYKIEGNYIYLDLKIHKGSYSREVIDTNGVIYLGKEKMRWLLDRIKVNWGEDFLNSILVK
jgi:putative membrane protein (TIGR04086 family)